MTLALIILDLMMPVMSGWEFLARQKRDARMQSVPVVVVTGSGPVRDVEADAVVHKPRFPLTYEGCEGELPAAIDTGSGPLLWPHLGSSH